MSAKYLLSTVAQAASLGLDPLFPSPDSPLALVLTPLASPPSSNPHRLPPSTALILRTSGSSSSRPRLVPLSANAILTRVRWMQTSFPDIYSGHACIKTSPLFVDSVCELLGPFLSRSPCLVLCPGPPSTDLLPTILNHRITHLLAVPTLWRMLLDQDRVRGNRLASSALRTLLSSGEALPASLCRRMRAQLPGRRILNIYGATETTADATCFEVPRDWDGQADGQADAAASAVLPVGLPFPGFSVVVVRAGSPEGGREGRGEDRLVPAGVGETGHVLIWGPGLAEGYLDPSEDVLAEDHSTTQPSGKMLLASAPCFVDLPRDIELLTTSPAAGEEGPTVRCFLPGDLGFQDAAGVLTVLGRTGQVGNLPGGVRVNWTQWAEERLRGRGDVAEAAARLDTSPDGDPTSVLGLVVGVVPRGGSEPLDAEALARWLAAAAPDNVRIGCVVLDTMPTARGSGKVLRRELPTPDRFFSSMDAGRKDGDDNAEDALLAPGPAPPSEARVLTVFRHVLGAPSLEPIQDFFRAGGDSLSAAEAAAMLDLPSLELLAAHPTARRLAAALASDWNPSGPPASESDPYSPGPSNKRQRTELAPPPPPPESLVLQGAAFDAWSGPHAHVLVLGRASRAFVAEPAAGSEPSGGVGIYAPVTLRVLAPESAASPPSQMPPLQPVWKCSLAQCVDGAPTLVLPLDPASLRPDERAAHCFVASHGGSVACLCAASGALVWRTELRGRVEAAVALGPSLAVLYAASYEGALFALHARDGRVLREAGLGAGVRADLIPCPGGVLVVDQAGRVHKATDEGGLASHGGLGEPLSASPAVAPSSGRVFLATTRGSLFALDPRGPAGFAPTPAWTLPQCVSTPFFAAPVLLCPRSPSPVLVACSVEGEAVGVGAGEGAILWRSKVAGLGLISQPLVSYDDSQGVAHLLLTGAKGLAVLRPNVSWTAGPIGRPEERVAAAGPALFSSAPCIVSAAPRVSRREEGGHDMGYELTHDLRGGDGSGILMAAGPSLQCVDVRQAGLQLRGVVAAFEDDVFSGPTALSLARVLVGSRGDAIFGLGI